MHISHYKYVRPQIQCIAYLFLVLFLLLLVLGFLLLLLLRCKANNGDRGARVRFQQEC